MVQMPRIDYLSKLEYESSKKFGVTVTIYEVTKFSTKDWPDKKVTIFNGEKFKNDFIFLPAFYLIMWLMKSSKIF